MQRLVPAVLIPLIASAMTACGGSAQPASRIHVVAAENFWGSIALQLGGDAVSVTSVLTDPTADPHEYQSSAPDARAFASADYVIVNGAGYDTWAQQLLDANPSDSRLVLNVARLVGKSPGDNPHLWYSPGYVEAVARQITSDYMRLDPAHAQTYRDAASAFAAAMQPLLSAVRDVAARFGGTPVAATEPLPAYLLDGMRLTLASPAAFMLAVEGGNDPSAQAVAAMQRLISAHAVRALLYNAQTATAITDSVVALAHNVHIGVVALTETVQPAAARYEDWMLGEVHALQAALQT